MNWLVVLQIVVGALITIGIVVFVEYFRKPRLKLTIAKPVDVPYTNRLANKARYLGLMVENEQLPRFVRWLSRSVAIHCYGTITFHHLDGQNVFGRSMQIRWSSSPEPLPIQGFISHWQTNWPQAKMEIFDPIRALPDLYMDIYPGESEGLDVAARFDDDPECYGWCNDNYFSKPPWRNSSWKLDSDRYLVKVEVTSAGVRCIAFFRLINDVPINDFRLENAQQDDYKKILG